VIEKKRNGFILEAEVHGDGIKMFLLSQGAWIKVIAPTEFVEEIKSEIEKMQNLY
jgi:predicted DNA-binding transcriptional regulator YafY